MKDSIVHFAARIIFTLLRLTMVTRLVVPSSELILVTFPAGVVPKVIKSAAVSDDPLFYHPGLIK